MLRGLDLLAGEHRIELAYAPRSLASAPPSRRSPLAAFAAAVVRLRRTQRAPGQVDVGGDA